MLRRRSNRGDVVSRGVPKRGHADDGLLDGLSTALQDWTVPALEK